MPSRRGLTSIVFLVLSISLISHQAQSFRPRSLSLTRFGISRRCNRVTMSVEDATRSERIVICGGGIIGASILYQLSLKVGQTTNRQRPDLDPDPILTLLSQGYKPILIERAQIAAAASGKSGGFLAR